MHTKMIWLIPYVRMVGGYYTLVAIESRREEGEGEHDTSTTFFCRFWLVRTRYIRSSGTHVGGEAVGRTW